MNTNIADGYIYCMSNPGMRDNTYKLGFTQNDPINRARQLYTEGVIEPFVIEEFPQSGNLNFIRTAYKIEFAKKVLFQKEKFLMIANILDEHNYRISKDRTFYNCDIDEIRNIFTGIKGVWYIPGDEDTDGEYENIVDEHEDTEEDKKRIMDDEEDETPPHHVMRNVFRDGQAIRHTVEGHSTWTGYYDKTKDIIIHNSIEYKTLPAFVEHHRETAL